MTNFSESAKTTKMKSNLSNAKTNYYSNKKNLYEIQSMNFIILIENNRKIKIEFGNSLISSQSWSKKLCHWRALRKHFRSRNNKISWIRTTKLKKRQNPWKSSSRNRNKCKNPSKRRTSIWKEFFLRNNQSWNNLKNRTSSYKTLLKALKNRSPHW